MERKVLGKGLEALMPKKSSALSPREFIYIKIDNLKPSPYQPRKTIDVSELNDLKKSIKEKGLIQPIVVRKTKEGFYEIVAGERRYQAAKSLGINELPSMVKDLSDKETLIISVVENLQRKDLNPLEEANAFKRLMDDFEFSLDEVANVIGKDKTTISNTIRLLKLPTKIQEALEKGIINRSQARTILTAESQNDQFIIFQQIIKEGLSVREIEKRVNPKPKRKSKKDPYVLEIEDTLQKALGTKVKILNLNNNKGKIIIEYYSLNDLDRIIGRFVEG
ncbi:MAG: ParB/RepB/Spo0J family partition protein [Candidatus Omnitrophota bacterium]